MARALDADGGGDGPGRRPRTPQVTALVERAAFLPSLLSAAELEVRNLDERPEYAERYWSKVPQLVYEDGAREVELPFIPPRLTATRVGQQLEAELAAIVGGGVNGDR